MRQQGFESRRLPPVEIFTPRLGLPMQIQPTAQPRKSSPSGFFEAPTLANQSLKLLAQEAVD